MAIYRGAGGAGDATGDSASEALLVRDLATQVTADAAAAEAAKVAAIAAKVAAENAETNAETAETNAETAETNAETAQAAAASSASAASTSATNAASSSSAASTSATNASNSATAAAGSASAASTSATNAASSASSASASASTATTQATNAANSASAAATSATNASNSASAAATSATNASNSATAASGSATSAASSASTATTQAGIATTQATNAAASASAASTSATNASNSASSASTSATNASNSASSAATSATNASNSATASASSASDAAASAAAAAASYDNFDDRYLGSKSSAPTLDNDGNALLTGALYYNNGTVTPADKGMYVYDGSQWIAASAASTAILTVYKFTATAGQTTFSGNDDNAVSLVYTAGSVIITLNGVVLEIPSEVTASSGTSVVLSTGAVAGDELNIYAFATFNVANTYTQAQSDATFLTKSNPSYTGTLTGGTGVVNIGSGQVYKDASGNVGIGTSSPTERLVVVNASTTAEMQLRGGTTAANYSQIGLYGGSTRNAEVSSNSAFLTLDHQNSGVINFRTGGSERMRIDSSGNVGVGTSSPTVKLDLYDSAGDAAIRIKSNGTNSTLFFARNGSGGDVRIRSNVGNDDLQFFTAGTERMRIDSSGNLLLGTTSFQGGATRGFQINATGTSSSNYAQLIKNGDGTEIFQMRNNGGLGNYSANNANLSDERVKTNIELAGSYLNKICSIPVKTFKYKNQTDDLLNLGVIAQDVEAVAPELVDVGGFGDTPEDGIPLKAIYQTDLQYALMKCIQEQQAIITDLRTELDSLKSEVTALKGQA